MIVVFDFDKTLSLKDTFNDFLFFIGKRGSYYNLKRVFYFFMTLARKFRIISNLFQKQVGCFLFIKPDLLYNEELLQEFVSIVKLNTTAIRELQFLKEDNTNRVIICSASPKYYLQIIFPEIEIIGMEFQENNGRLTISQHPYKEKKKELINLLGLNKIDILFTDSYSDKSLVEISNCTRLVRGHLITPCLNLEEFKRSARYSRWTKKS